MDNRTRTHPRWLALLLLASSLAASSGCTTYCNCRDWVRNGFKVGPEYCKPAAPVAEDWIGADDRRVTSDAAQTANWWLTFDDAVLNNLVQAAMRKT